MRWLAVLGFVGACYAPHPPTGAPCPDNICPTGLVCSTVTHTCELTQPTIDAPVIARDAAPDATEDANVDADTTTFKHRRRITIHNQSTQVMPAGMTITVPFATLTTLVATNEVLASFDDLRVIGDTVGERDRIIDPPGGPAPIAFHFSLGQPIAAGATSTEYAVYYSYAAAGAAPANGRNVFPIYEDFSIPLASVWLQNDAPQLANGHLTLRANHTDGITTTAANDNIPIISCVELVASVSNVQSDPTMQPEGLLYYWFGYQHTGDFSASDPWIVWIARGKTSMGAEQKSPVGCEAGCAPTPGTNDTAPHYYEVMRNPNETRFYRDSNGPVMISVQNTEDYSPIVRNFLAAGDVVIDWLRVRARVSPDPAINVGAEENL